VSVEQAMNSQGVETNGTHHVSPTEDKRVRLAVSLDTAGHGPRLHVRDNETGDDILLSAIELASLCLATSEDRAGWLRVGLYRTDVAAGPHGSGVDAGGHQGAAE
jgi:hypothetical protein